MHEENYPEPKKKVDAVDVIERYNQVVSGLTDAIAEARKILGQAVKDGTLILEDVVKELKESVGRENNVT